MAVALHKVQASEVLLRFNLGLRGINLKLGGINLGLGEIQQMAKPILKKMEPRWDWHDKVHLCRVAICGGQQRLSIVFCMKNAPSNIVKCLCNVTLQ